MAESEKKSYQLKPIETQLLNVANQQAQVMLSNLLTFIASERLAITVNEQTRYEISPDLKEFKVWQEPVEVVTEPVKDKK